MRYVLICLLTMTAGCAEVSLYNQKEDCGGKYNENNYPASYPCHCCKDGF